MVALFGSSRTRKMDAWPAHFNGSTTWGNVAHWIFPKKKRNDCWSLELPTASLKPSSVEPCGQHTPILTATKLLKTDEYCGHMTHGQKFQQLCNIFQGTMTIQRCSTFWTNWQIETKNESREVVRSEPSSHIFTLFQKKHPDMLPLSTQWHNTGAN